MLPFGRYSCEPTHLSQLFPVSPISSIRVHPLSYWQNSFNPGFGNAKSILKDAQTTRQLRMLLLSSAKTKCDGQKPDCQACVLAGISCITTDKRRPGTCVERKEASKHAHGVFLGGSNPNRATPKLLRPAALTPLPLQSCFDPLENPSASPIPTGSRVPSFTENANHPLSLAATSSSNSHVPSHTTTTTLDASTAQQVCVQARLLKTFEGKLPMVPRIRGQDSLQILIGWLDLAFYRLGVSQQVRSFIELRDSPPPKQAFPFSMDLPPLPEPEVRCQVVQQYFQYSNTIFAALNPNSINAILDDTKSPQEFVQNGQLPSLLLMYLLICIGSFNSSLLSSDVVSDYIAFCTSTLGHIMGRQSFDGVQIVFLLSICPKCQDQSVSAWHMLGLCVSTARTLGLHRSSSLRRQPLTLTASITIKDEQRLWWAIYSFEKLFAFDVGRESIMYDADCDQPKPATVWGGACSGSDFPGLVISLPTVLSQISKRCFRSTHEEEAVDGGAIESAFAVKKRTTRKTVLLLTR